MTSTSVGDDLPKRPPRHRLRGALLALVPSMDSWPGLNRRPYHRLPSKAQVRDIRVAGERRRHGHQVAIGNEAHRRLGHQARVMVRLMCMAEPAHPMFAGLLEARARACNLLLHVAVHRTS
jgi:hypothetical protein